MVLEREACLDGQRCEQHGMGIWGFQDNLIVPEQRLSHYHHAKATKRYTVARKKREGLHLELKATSTDEGRTYTCFGLNTRGFATHARR